MSEIHYLIRKNPTNGCRDIEVQVEMVIFRVNRYHGNCTKKDNNRSRWDKVFKNGPSKICGRQPLKNFNWCINEYLVSDSPSIICFCYIIYFYIK